MATSTGYGPSRKFISNVTNQQTQAYPTDDDDDDYFS